MTQLMTGAVLFTIMTAVLVFMLGPLALLGGAAGSFLAARVLSRRQPPPFGVNRKQFAVPAYFFTDEFTPLRERLKANVNATVSPLFVALVAAGVYGLGFWVRGGAGRRASSSAE